ncbi:hypothetical protein KY343_01485 [Candidatus Woesearchaeota archaeon]|nr:hypothetical protein [Candidatus Woesearchaeota archaeon]
MTDEKNDEGLESIAEENTKRWVCGNYLEMKAWEIEKEVEEALNQAAGSTLYEKAVDHIKSFLTGRRYVDVLTDRIKERADKWMSEMNNQMDILINRYLIYQEKYSQLSKEAEELKSQKSEKEGFDVKNMKRDSRLRIIADEMVHLKECMKRYETVIPTANESIERMQIARNQMDYSRDIKLIRYFANVVHKTTT